jgi:xylose isomerase
MAEFFTDVAPLRFEGPETETELAFRVYDPDRVVLGGRMADHLRMAVCYWHSFHWPGNDVFGAGTFDRPWLEAGRDPMGAARMKMDAAFEFFAKLGVPFFCFHDADVAPTGDTFAESKRNLEELVDLAGQHMERTGVQLLWGTSNAFSHPRFAAGASTNPDPEVFAYAAAQVKNAIDATHRLGGANYVLWGGREGYETLLNTRMRQEADQLARFLTMVVEYKHAIGFDGTLLIEPKPQEPTKHQYDYDCATVHGFLDRYDLVGELFVNIEVNHATLAGHSFHHEVAYAVDNGIFGSVDANRGDPQNGWDTDQFPNSVEEMSLALYEILRGGGFTTGGLNFDTKLRRQSLDRADLFHGHAGAMDTVAQSLLVAARLLEDGELERIRDRRYAGWGDGLGAEILDGQHSLADLEQRVTDGALDPRPVSGGQERLENLVNRTLWRAVSAPPDLAPGD